MEPVLDIRAAHKRFASTTALEGASLTVERGEWLALLGPNGAGKTTLVRSITGRVRLDSGTIELFGEPAGQEGKPSARQRRLGFVPQDLALYPRLTAHENLVAFGELLGLRGRELAERIDWSLSWSGLGERAREPVGSFSGGMKRRLNIACGVLHRPDLVLLDEPTVGVDPQSRERIWEMLAELRRQGASLLLTTHQLDEAQRIADRIVIIDHGRDIANGDFEALVRQTIGPGRRVTFTLREPPPAALENSSLELDGLHARTHVEQLGEELPRLLEQLAAAGATVTDVDIEAPSLQAVFLHLTGRELRE